MKFSKLKQNKWYRFFTNKYILILVFFAVWMIFFDTNSYFLRDELNEEIDALEERSEYYQNEIEKDKAFLKKIEDSHELEQYAREKYYLKKENEDIYIIQYEDSLNNQKNE